MENEKQENEEKTKKYLVVDRFVSMSTSRSYAMDFGENNPATPNEAAEIMAKSEDLCKKFEGEEGQANLEGLLKRLEAKILKMCSRGGSQFGGYSYISLYEYNKDRSF